MIEKKFENYISLGFFCGVAEDLEKLGLRNQSSPFDWGISDFREVIRAIDSQFEGFLQKDNLSQELNDRAHYRDDSYNFCFFHDFNKYKTLDRQFDNVKEKYNRRIARFLHTIEKPTLFIHYISPKKNEEDQSSDELQWIENNIQQIYEVIRRYNSENDIIFIGDETIYSDKIKVYQVDRDEGDEVSRSPIINNKELFQMLETVDYPDKQKNIARYQQKVRKRETKFARLKRKCSKYFSKLFFKEYEHNRTYS